MTSIDRVENGTVVKKKGWPWILLTALRPHQWTKNLFIFAPLLFAKRLTDPAAISNSVLAFVVFCFLASGLYIFNDWIDIDEDRAHPEKRKRPLSSGQLSVTTALIAFVALVIGAFGLAIYIGPNFLVVAAIYFLLVLSYCLVLKRLIILDCMTLATGFVLRVVGGAVAIGVTASHWLIVCAFLLALFLAFSKRRQELLELSDEAANHRAVLGHYSVNFLGQVNIVLVAASIVCYALYTVAPETIERFRTDSLIYGTAFVIYGMLRYMALIENPANGGNPSRTMVQDRPLLIALIMWAIYNVSVIYGGGSI